MPIKKWQIRDYAKDIIQQTKLDRQEKFKYKMSLLVDISRPESEDTNKGNTAHWSRVGIK